MLQQAQHYNGINVCGSWEWLLGAISTSASLAGEVVTQLYRRRSRARAVLWSGTQVAL